MRPGGGAVACCPVGTTPERLVDRRPALDRARLLDDMVPPPRFSHARLATYEPDPAQPSQRDARERVGRFAAATGPGDGPGPRRGLGRLLGARSRAEVGPRGLYLDGGFGVGKTHLLAAAWHEAAGRKHYGTFVEYTHLAGALGFRGAVEALQGADLVCIDEFELDDPGDTVLMARLLRELTDSGARLAATSNTLPGALGTDRFAAEDFLREIQALGRLFEVVTVDGEDYRHRGAPPTPGAGHGGRDRRPRRPARGHGRRPRGAVRAPGHRPPQPLRRPARRRHRGGRGRPWRPSRTRTSPCGSSSSPTGCTTAPCP